MDDISKLKSAVASCISALTTIQTRFDSAMLSADTSTLSGVKDELSGLRSGLDAMSAHLDAMTPPEPTGDETEIKSDIPDDARSDDPAPGTLTGGDDPDAPKPAAPEVPVDEAAAPV